FPPRLVAPPTAPRRRGRRARGSRRTGAASGTAASTRPAGRRGRSSRTPARAGRRPPRTAAFLTRTKPIEAPAFARPRGPGYNPPADVSGRSRVRRSGGARGHREQARRRADVLGVLQAGAGAHRAGGQDGLPQGGDGPRARGRAGDRPVPDPRGNGAGADRGQAAGHARTATVTAVTDVRLAGVTEWVFRGLLREHPSIAVNTLESIAGRLRAVSRD